MLKTRVIPVLLLRNGGLVKTVKFDRANYLGDPLNAVKIFNDKEVDELVVLDIDASKRGHRPNFELVKQLASECFMPLGYGGGIKSVEDIGRLFTIGVEKVVINSAGLCNLDLVANAAQVFGNQSIVLSVDVKKNLWGNFTVYSHAKVPPPPVGLLTFLQQASQAGAGEILLNAVDRDGTMTGYDLTLIQQVAQAVPVPVVACGGAGQLAHLRQAADAGASGVAAGSLFVYHGPHRAVLINYPAPSVLQSLLG
ncbi:MAG: AglZ/HisF2 family acetamidino modification protein [Bernardetiaceae bacterium]|nr:AglZ/HisF2 family acetamidino modification protein [Bernardetiaceae bacterium]